MLLLQLGWSPLRPPWRYVASFSVLVLIQRWRRGIAPLLANQVVLEVGTFSRHHSPFTFSETQNPQVWSSSAHIYTTITFSILRVWVCVYICVGVCTCVCLIPDVAVEDFSECVKAADHKRHDAEEGESGQGADALQHRVNPHTCHLLHPTGPEWAETQLEVRKG